ncbi:MAG: MFS transporter [Micromonosporaceae bacterium]
MPSLPSSAAAPPSGRAASFGPSRPSGAAWLVWGIGLVAYLVAIFHRFSLGVAGIDAAERLGVSAATLALFPVLQLLVYAAMQIPVGVLLDRYGSRRLLLAGLALMTTGQAAFAVAQSVPVGLAARVLLGAGDAMIFISVLRLAAVWFPSRWVSVVVQLTGVIGQLGAVLSAAPLSAALGHYGWTASYLAAAVVGGLVMVPVLLGVVDSPHRDAPRPAAMPLAALRRNLVAAWREPGTRLGLWTHFTTQFSGVIFALLWGFPFLVSGEGLSPGTASALLTLYILAGIGIGPMLGHLAGRYAFHRSRMTLTVIGLAAAGWTLVLAWPGRAPLPVLVLLVLAMAPCGPGSMIGFDHARTFNPGNRLGSATGIVNVGGFTASLLSILAIGVVLDLLGGAGTQSSLGAFKVAFAFQYVFWLLGAVQILRYRSRARATLAATDPERYAALRRGEPLAAAA